MNRSLPLLLAIGDIDSRHIQEIETIDQHRRTVRFVQVSAFVACFALVVTLPCGIFLHKSHSNIPSTQTEPSEFVSTQMPSPENITFEELVHRADVIVSAEVTAEYREPCTITDSDYLTDTWLSIYAPTDHSTAYTLSVEITVEEALKGNISVNETICLFNNALEEYDQSGSYIRTQYLNDTKLMKEGDRVILFLNAYGTEEKEYFLVGEAGKWFLDTNGTYRCGLLYDNRFPNDYTPRVGLKQYTAYTLDEMKNNM